MTDNIETIFIHGGNQGDIITGAVNTPIFTSTTYAQTEIGNNKYEYSRCSNPTRDSLESCIAESEYAKYACAFSSGLSAIQAVLTICNKEVINILAIDDLYGGTMRMFKNNMLTPVKINLTTDNFNFVNDKTHPSDDTFLINDIDIIWVESPTNPLLKAIDINKLCNYISDISPKSPGPYVIVDNTFATPYLQNPIKMGADVVIHSGTKYINGHTDVLMGFAITKNEVLYKYIKKYQYQVGAVPSPFDCYLILRGIKTLHVRMDRQCDNADKIYNFLLQKQEKNLVGKIYYPINSNMKRNGAMISFELCRSKDFIMKEMSQKLKFIKVAESLGSVETLINVPAFMTHASIDEKIRQQIGITDNLIRISVGIEYIDDIINDLERIFN